MIIIIHFRFKNLVCMIVVTNFASVIKKVTRSPATYIEERTSQRSPLYKGHKDYG